MSTTEAPKPRATAESLPENFRGVQPGGGKCYQLELLWGRWRRLWLRTFRPGYVKRMADCRHGSAEGSPHEVLDPRDLKYVRNLCTCDWDQSDDAFQWRDRLPFARWGLAELQLMGWPLLAVTILVATTSFWYMAVVPGVLLGLVVYFFRDPPRRIPEGAGLVVSPADGKIAEITRLDYDEFIGGPAVRIGIFLSIFNVHLNRAPVKSRVISLRYHPGEFLNALKAESTIHNENTWIGLEDETSPHRKMVVRQISGAIARRIVCNLRPGEVVERGHNFGMIKLGSRTELILPDGADLSVEVAVGEKVKAGTTIMARYAN